MPQNVYLKQKIYVHKSLDFWVHFIDLDILNSGPPLHYVAYLGMLSAYILNKTKVPLEVDITIRTLNTKSWVAINFDFCAPAPARPLCRAS